MGCGQSTGQAPAGGEGHLAPGPGTPGPTTPAHSKPIINHQPSRGSNRVHPEPDSRGSVDIIKAKHESGPLVQPSITLNAPNPPLRSWHVVRAELLTRGLILASPSSIAQAHGAPGGVSPAFLHALSAVIDPRATSSEVIQQIILPACDEYGCSRFIDLVPPEHKAPPQYLVSHWQGTPLVDTLNAVYHHMAITCAKSDLTAAATWPSVARGSVWLDVLCSGKLNGQKHDGGAAFAEVEQVCHEVPTLLLVLADPSAKSLTRLWVITELIKLKSLAQQHSQQHSTPTIQLVGHPTIIAASSNNTSQPQSLQQLSLQLTGAAQPTLTSQAMAAAITVCQLCENLEVSRTADRTFLEAFLSGYGPVLEVPGALQEEIVDVLKGAAERQVDDMLAACMGFAVAAGGAGRERDSICTSLPNGNGDDVTVRASREVGLTHPQSDSSTAAAAAAVVMSVEAGAVGALRAADALMVAGTALHAMREHTYAEAALRRALQLRGKILGPDTVPTARATLALSCLLADANFDEEAEPLLRKGISRAKKCMGKDHAEVGDGLSRLGVLLAKQGKTEEAEAALKSALRVQVNAIGHAHTRTIATGAHLGAVLRDLGKVSESLTLYQSVMDNQVQVYGSHHPHVATTAGSIAYLLQVQGQVDQALPMAQRALEIMQEHYGNDSPLTAAAQANLGNLLRTMGQDQQAWNALQAALDSLARIRGEQHPDTVAVRASLSELEKHMMNSKSGSPTKIKAVR